MRSAECGVRSVPITPPPFLPQHTHTIINVPRPPLPQPSGDSLDSIEKGEFKSKLALASRKEKSVYSHLEASDAAGQDGGGGGGGGGGGDGGGGGGGPIQRPKLRRKDSLVTFTNVLSSFIMSSTVIYHIHISTLQP